MINFRLRPPNVSSRPYYYSILSTKPRVELWIKTFKYRVTKPWWGLLSCVSCSNWSICYGKILMQFSYCCFIKLNLFFKKKICAPNWKNCRACVNRGMVGDQSALRVISSVSVIVSFYFTLKTYFFYFIYSFLQNTYINLFILHIYSIKYSFFYYFLLFLYSLPLFLFGRIHYPFSHIPNTTKKTLMWMFFCTH